MVNIQRKIELNAERREVIGRAVRRLRKSGFIPAVLYGKKQDSISLQVPEKDFYKTLKEAGESTLVYLSVNEETYPTIIHGVDRDPVKDDIIHADFYKVRLDEKIKAHVAVVFTGESPAVKNLNGILVKNINELEVEALPQNLPHELTIDVSILANFGDRITIKDLKKGLGDLAELTIEDDDTIIATVQEPKSAEELEAELAEPATDVSEVEIGDKKAEDDDNKEEAIEGGEVSSEEEAKKDSKE